MTESTNPAIVDHILNDEEDPLDYVGSPVIVDYDTGQIEEVNDGRADNGADPTAG